MVASAFPVNINFLSRFLCPAFLFPLARSVSSPIASFPLRLLPLSRPFPCSFLMYMRLLRRFAPLCQAVGNVQKWAAIHITEGTSRVQTAERNITALGVELRQFGRCSIPFSMKHRSAILIKEQDEDIYYLSQARTEKQLSDAFARTLSSMKLFILRQGSLEQLAVAKDARFATWRITGFLTGVTEPAIEDLLTANETAWADLVRLYNAAGRKGVRLCKAFAPGPDYFPVFECSSETPWIAMAITDVRHEDKFKDD